MPTLATSPSGMESRATCKMYLASWVGTHVALLKSLPPICKNRQSTDRGKSMSRMAACEKSKQAPNAPAHPKDTNSGSSPAFLMPVCTTVLMESGVRTMSQEQDPLGTKYTLCGHSLTVGLACRHFRIYLGQSLRLQRLSTN